MSPQEAFLNKKAWTKAIKGWRIVDCALRDRNFLYVILRKDVSARQGSKLFNHEIPTRVLALYRHKTDPQEQWGYQDLNGFQLPFCGVSLEPVAQCLTVSTNGDVYAAGSGHTGMEKIPDEGTSLVLRKVRCIEGYAYAVGNTGDVYRRLEIGQWETIRTGFRPNKGGNFEALLNKGFHDIDGFSQDDIYTVGGSGEVWHYDGQAWSPCQFPTKISLFTVCCAGDGLVYISGKGKSLFQGRGNSWKQICQADSSTIEPRYNDTLWFDGKLWLASDWGLYELVGPVVQRAQHAGEPVSGSGHMAVGDGVLMIAGDHKARIFDGSNWSVLVAPYS